MPLESLLDYALRSTLLIAAAGIMACLLRRTSAARRHLVWLVAVTMLLALPAIRRVAPRWEAPAPARALLKAPLRTVVEVTGQSESGPDQRRSRNFLWLSIWLAGSAFFLTRYARAQWLAHGLARRSRPSKFGTDVRISSHLPVPMVCGLLNPVIVLPEDSRLWTVEQRESVIAHERMHIRRRDMWWQALAQVVCAVYWPQPLVWLAAAAMRKECEQACDDGVLVGGTPASAYAGYLVSIARALSHRNTAPAGGIAMTRTSQLQQRIHALLDPSADRRHAGRTFASAAIGLAFALTALVATVDTPVFAQQNRFAGVVKDPSGAVVQNARLDLRVAGGNFHEVVYSNAAGEYRIEDVPEGVYDLTISVPGFARLIQSGMKFEPGKSPRFDFTVNVGMMQESVQVKAEGSPRAAAPVTGTPQRIRVGGNIQSAKLVSKTNPVYPPTAKADGVVGTVLMRAVIGKEGSVLNLESINKSVDARLVDNAMNAVRQWVYTPTLLNGQPVEIVTEIEVNYTLSQ